MSEGRAIALRRGLIGTCALLALVLLATFYTIVNGAVDRAAHRRHAASAHTSPVAVQHQGGQDPALLARVGN